MRKSSIIIILFLISFCLNGFAGQKGKTLKNPFFTFSNALHKRGIPIEEQALLLKKYGFDGIEHIETSGILELKDAFKKQGLKIYADYRGDWRVPEADEYPNGMGYWRMDQSKSGGVVYEMGAHIIDVNNWIFDSEPMSVSSFQGVNNFSLRKRDSSDHAGVLVEYANGAFLNYGGNVYNYGASAMDTFFCVNGTVQIGGGKIHVSYGYPSGFPKPGDLPKNEIVPAQGANPEGEGVVEELKHFAKVLAGNAKPYPDGYIARQTVQICEGSVRAAKERRVIDVKELG